MTTVSADAIGPEIRTFPWWLILLEGIVATIIGLLLLSSPVITTAILIQVLGIYWLVAGILSLVGIFVDSTLWGWKLFSGLLGILAGIVVIQHPIWSTFLIPTTVIIVIAIAGILIGVMRVIAGFMGAGWGAVIVGILSAIFGLILLGFPLFGTATLVLIMGVATLVGGVTAIISAFRLR